MQNYYYQTKGVVAVGNHYIHLCSPMHSFQTSFFIYHLTSFETIIHIKKGMPAQNMQPMVTKDKQWWTFESYKIINHP